MHPVKIVPLTFLLLACLAPAQDGPDQKPNVFLQNDRVKNEKESNTRTIDGTVKDASDNPLPDALVQLKNTKTLQIRSFITRDNGAYYFHGLSTDVDYELRADFDGASSSARTLSSFDNRKEPVVNLKLEPKK